MIIDNARVFTALDEQALEGCSVRILDGRIAEVAPTAAMTSAPPEEARMDASGRFLMPGMTETHAHLSFADASPFAIGDTPVEDATITAVRNAELMLASGFTSAVSFGSTYKIDVALRNAINAGRIPGPRLLAAGRDLGATASNVDSPSGLSQIADGPWALRRAVREQRRDGVDVVKMFNDGENINPVARTGEVTFCDEEAHAIVDEAHRRGLRVASHSRSAAAVKQSVRAGVDFIGHANYLDEEAVALLAQVKDRVVVGPAIAWEVQYLAQCETLGISQDTVRAQGYEAEIEATQRSVEMLRAAGVRLVVGGDYGISIAPHGTYAKDLEYFVTLFGMSPAQALICATRNGGEAFDPGGSVGVIRAGAKADLVLVSGDPLSDITVLQDHSRLQVMKGGRWHDK